MDGVENASLAQSERVRSNRSELKTGGYLRKMVQWPLNLYLYLSGLIVLGILFLWLIFRWRV